MEEQNQKSIGAAVFEKIKSGQVKMHPKIYFVLKSVLAVLAVVIFVLFILYLVSFIIFSLRASGTWFMPRFGFPGLKIFFISLPWVPIAIAGVLVVLLEVLAKRFNFIYRKPIIYSFLGIVLIAIVGGFLLEKTPLHSILFSKARERDLPGIGSIYREFGSPRTKDGQMGTVIIELENGYIIQRPDGGTTTVIVTEKTRTPKDETIEEGDNIIVIGKSEDGQVEAFEIREIKEDFDFFPPGPPPSDNPDNPGQFGNPEQMVD
jgi:hypothetical protein